MRKGPHFYQLTASRGSRDLRSSSAAGAAGAEEAGFWPVMRFPSTWTNGPQSGPFVSRPPSRFNSFSTRNGTTLASWAASCEQHLPILHHFDRLEIQTQLGRNAGVAVCAEVEPVPCVQSDKKLIYIPIKKGLHSEKVRPNTTCKGDHRPGKERDAGAPLEGACPQRHAHQGCTVFE